jgi:hypothetical protein
MMPLLHLTVGRFRTSRWTTWLRFFGCSILTWHQQLSIQSRTKDSKFGWVTANFRHILPQCSSITFMGSLSFLGMSHITEFRLAMHIAPTGTSVPQLFNECLWANDGGLQNTFLVSAVSAQRWSNVRSSLFQFVLAVVSMKTHTMSGYAKNRRSSLYGPSLCCNSAHGWSPYILPMISLIGLSSSVSRNGAVYYLSPKFTLTCRQSKPEIEWAGFPFLKDVLLSNGLAFKRHIMFG